MDFTVVSKQSLQHRYEVFDPQWWQDKVYNTGTKCSIHSGVKTKSTTPVHRTLRTGVVDFVLTPLWIEHFGPELSTLCCDHCGSRPPYR
jgi:hypothetical protein